ncbi:hypothetical protein EOM81_08485 [bacterium]|nr:hypothetical protein [bacterium]
MSEVKKTAFFLICFLAGIASFGNDGEAEKNLTEKGLPSYHKYLKQAGDTQNYVGSESCAKCHSDIYDEWKLSQHARMIRSVEEIKQTVPIPFNELEVSEDKIIMVLGSHYVHRFVAEHNGKAVVLPKIWDIRENRWLETYDYGWQSKEYTKECAGCHTTGFSAENECFTEPGVGCEACHGPGEKHIKTQNPKDIASRHSLSPEKLEMVCISCHTSGMDNSYTYSFPVSYRPGDDITKHFSGLTPKPGQTAENFSGDESYEDRLRQWTFLKPRLLLASGLTCDYCLNFRNVKKKNEGEYLTYNQYCMTCHSDKEDHPEQSPGTDCIVCHKPNRHLNGSLSIHDHKFRFE